MLYAPGSRVRFKYTGAEGTVVERIDAQMLNVRLDDGEVIPAFEEDVMRIEDYLKSKNPIKAKSVQGKQVKKPEQPKRLPGDSQYAILKSKGIQLGFEAEKRLDSTTAKYLIHLINDTKYDVLYSFTLSHSKMTPKTSNGKIDRLSTVVVGELPFDDLNESPVIDMDCWQVTTQGTGAKLSNSIKIKAKQFFKKIMTAPILNIPVHHYVVFDNFIAPDEAQKDKEDLSSYTKRKAKEQPKSSKDNSVFAEFFESTDTEEFASFNNELDLHIENLTDTTSGMDNGDILHLQLRVFESYMKDAIRIGVPKVFIIHGLGKGRLKNDIHKWLELNPYVDSFKNEYHHKFGYGATEVEL